MHRQPHIEIDDETYEMLRAIQAGEFPLEEIDVGAFREFLRSVGLSGNSAAEEVFDRIVMSKIVLQPKQSLQAYGRQTDDWLRSVLSNTLPAQHYAQAAAAFAGSDYRSARLLVGPLINSISMQHVVRESWAPQTAFRKVLSHFEANTAAYRNAASVFLGEPVERVAGRCEVCGVLSERRVCQLCNDRSRDLRSLFIVGDTGNVLNVELGCNWFNGRYYLLGEDFGKAYPPSDYFQHGSKIDRLASLIEGTAVTEIFIPEFYFESKAAHAIKHWLLDQRSIADAVEIYYVDQAMRKIRV